MVQEHSIRAALHAEAGAARVPTEEILKRIRRAAAQERRSVLPRPAGIRSLVQVVAACALLSLLFLLPTLRGWSAPGTAQGGGRLITYENDLLGVRVAFPVSFETPAIDEFGRIALRFDAGEITIGRQERQAQPAADVVVVAPGQGQGQVVVTREQRTLAGRPATYTRSPASEMYVVTTDSAQYVVRCGAPAGTAQADWVTLQPVCDKVMSTLELGVKFGVTREEAEAAAVQAVPGDVVAFRAVLEGTGTANEVPPPVWRVYLLNRGDGTDAGVVTVSYQTGTVIRIDKNQP